VGWIADTKLTPVTTFTGAVAIVGFMNFCWIAVSDRVGLYVFSIFYGLAISAAQGVYASSLASLSPDPSRVGTRFGMVCSIIAFPILAGPPTAGALLKAGHGDFLFSQLWAGSVSVAAVLLLGLISVLRSRHQRQIGPSEPAAHEMKQ